MKRVITIWALLFPLFFYAQSRNVYVEYGVKIFDEKDLFSKNSDVRGFFEKAMSHADRASFGLVINSSGSKFFDNNANIIYDDDNYGMSLVFAGFSGDVFQFQNAIYSEQSMLGKGTMVKEKAKENWELHNETKMIDNYLCFKATNINRVENGAGVFNHPVTAWYCPKLPYSYGPKGYGGLPGLILELQVRNATYGAKRIDLNTSLNFDATFLMNIKTISMEDFNKKLQSQAENFKGR